MFIFGIQRYEPDEIGIPKILEIEHLAPGKDTEELNIPSYTIYDKFGNIICTKKATPEVESILKSSKLVDLSQYNNIRMEDLGELNTPENVSKWFFGQEKDGERNAERYEQKIKTATSELKSDIRRFYSFKEESGCNVVTLEKHLHTVVNASYRLKEVVDTLELLKDVMDAAVH